MFIMDFISTHPYSFRRITIDIAGMVANQVLCDGLKVGAWKIYADEVETEKLEVEIVSLQPIERKMVMRSLLDVRPTVRSGFTIIPKNHHVSARNKCASYTAYT